MEIYKHEQRGKKEEEKEEEEKEEEEDENSIQTVFREGQQLIENLATTPYDDKYTPITPELYTTAYIPSSGAIPKIPLVDIWHYNPDNKNAIEFVTGPYTNEKGEPFYVNKDGGTKKKYEKGDSAIQTWLFDEKGNARMDLYKSHQSLPGKTHTEKVLSKASKDTSDPEEPKQLVEAAEVIPEVNNLFLYETCEGDSVPFSSAVNKDGGPTKEYEGVTIYEKTLSGNCVPFGPTSTEALGDPLRKPLINPEEMHVRMSGKYLEPGRQEEEEDAKEVDEEDEAAPEVGPVQGGGQRRRTRVPFLRKSQIKAF